MSTPKEIVDSAINEHIIVVFSKTWCPYSKRAKELLTERNSEVDPYIIELDKRDDGAALQSYLNDRTGQKTVPNVFIKQQHIGGSDTLADLDRADGIRPLLK